MIYWLRHIEFTEFLLQHKSTLLVYDQHRAQMTKKVKHILQNELNTTLVLLLFRSIALPIYNSTTLPICFAVFLKFCNSTALPLYQFTLLYFSNSTTLPLYQFTLLDFSNSITLLLYRSTNLLCCISQILQLYRSHNSSQSIGRMKTGSS